VADVRIRGGVDELVDAISTLRRLADEYEDDGLAPDDIWPRLRAAREHVDGFEAEVRRAIREAG
jgi:hypothetical protein